jgi:XRE family transcriptional regulator, regulator of sulfur utilization
MIWEKDLNIKQLDETISRFNKLSSVPRPDKGWINTIRSSLGMSARILGERIGLSQPRIALIEKGEVDGSISIKTLEKAAHGLGCRVIFALIPEEGTLQEMREKQALKKARQINQYTEHHMALEEQTTGFDFKEQSIKNMVDEDLRKWPRNFWDDL